MANPQDTARRDATGNLRPVAIRRDLDQIADLLDVAFADERRPGHGSAEGFSLLKGYGPLVALLSPFSPSLRECFTGYVWEEKGRIVGNASVSRLKGANEVWIVGNVGVHPDVRRHGIARLLTARAVDHARAEGARMVVLDVREENAPALALYTSMGFRPAGGHVQLLTSHADALHWPPSRARADQAAAGSNSTGDAVLQLALEPLRRQNWEAVALLAAACEEDMVAAANPWLDADFRPSPIGRLTWLLREWFLGQTSGNVGAWADGHLVAWAGLQPERFAEGHRFHLRVLPAWQGQAEEGLLAWALGRLGRRPAGPLVAEVPLSQRAAIELLEGAGLRRGTCLLRLALPLLGEPP